MALPLHRTSGVNPVCQLTRTAFSRSLGFLAFVRVDQSARLQKMIWFEQHLQS